MLVLSSLCGGESKILREGKWVAQDKNSTVNGSAETWMAEVWITMLWNYEMYHIFSSLCLKIKRDAYHRQGKSRGHLPMVCSWLIHSTWTLTAARSPVVTVKSSWTWELPRVPTFNFYNNQIPCRGFAEDAHWSPFGILWQMVPPADAHSICLLAKFLRGRSSQDPGPWNTPFSKRLDGPFLTHCPVFV